MYRDGRITASKFYSATHTNQQRPSVSLLRSICYPETTKFVSVQTEWGCSHEKTALEAYKTSLMCSHSNVTLEPCGFFICVDEPHLGATPDSLLCCVCHGQGIVEVKCPYSARDLLLSEAAEQKKHFFLKLCNGCLQLSTSHSYYYQVQLQLHVTKRNYCDFVVWTSRSLHVERIFKDDYLLQTMLMVAKTFHEVCMPELLAKWFTRDHVIAVPRGDENRPADDEDDGSWCLCKEMHGGDMIACDNAACPVGWYHLKCLKLKKMPTGKWLCLKCHAAMRCSKPRKSF